MHMDDGWMCVYIHTYMCVCVCIYICMYVCMYVCIYVCMYGFMGALWIQGLLNVTEDKFEVLTDEADGLKFK